MQTKCIGGPHDGFYVDGDERTVTVYPAPEPLPHSLDFDFNNPSPCEATISAPQPTRYLLRTVHCQGVEICFYAPEAWDDLRALRKALG